MLTSAELRRYARHIIMPEVGLAGQEKLRTASAVIVGAGGLGSPSAYYLAAAGVGRLGIVDFDVVDETNLHRQILHFDSDAGRAKVESAEQKLHGINPHIAIETHPLKLTSENALDIFARYDIVLDGTDNFATRYLVNDACVLLGKPNVYGSIFRFDGQVSVFWAKHGPCYRCLFPLPPPPGEVPSCAEAGVLGVLPGIVGALQASEAIKLILGVGEPLLGVLLTFDALGVSFRRLQIGRDPECPVCGRAPSITKLIDYDEFCKMQAQRPEPVPEVSVTELSQRLISGADFTLLDVREPHELDISKVEPSLHIPMNQVVARSGELDKGREILVLCRTGNRSGTITQVLRLQGFDAKNVAGGINAYAREVDPSIPQY